MAEKSVENQLPEARRVEALSEFFKVMGDPTRLRILWMLDNGEICVCNLAEQLQMTVSAISHQLRALRAAKLVKSRRQGKHIYYSLDDEHVRAVLETAMQHLDHQHQ